MNKKFGSWSWLVSLIAFSAISAQAAGNGRAAPVQVLNPKVSGEAENNAADTSSGPDWKGPARMEDFSVGALAGLGLVDSRGGFALIGNIAKRILDPGFVPDINNPVYIEAELGPVLTAGTSALFYSAHLRWDFIQNSEWTFYALGGLGGLIESQALGNHAEFFPRVGVGAFWTLDRELVLRAEVSHELIAVGISFPF